MVRCPSGVTRIRTRPDGTLTSFDIGVVNTDRADVVGENFAQLVGGDLTHEAAAPAEHRDARRGIAGGTAADLAPRAHLAVEPRRLLLVDQAHRPLVELLGNDEFLVGGGDDIDDSVADAEDVEAGVGHGGSFMLGRKRRPSGGGEGDQPVRRSRWRPEPSPRT
jgi:hypothetical protein